MFISIEGPDKAGKSTQVKLLEEYSLKKNLGWIFTRNPGGSKLGLELRKIVLDSEQKISDLAELMIYLADRAQHVEEFIKPLLDKGKTVFCDRFADSTLAYQGYGRGINLDSIKLLNKIVCKGIEPDLTILLDISDNEAEARSTGEKDRLEKENKLFHLRVKNGYRSIARENPLRFKIISVDNKTKEELHQEILSLIETFLAKQNKGKTSEYFS
jgi:dTMP kinase